MPNVTLQPGVPVELYTETGIDAGTALVMYNNYSTNVKVSDTLAGLSGADYINVLGYESASNKAGDAEAWALAVNGGFINVKEA